MFRSRFLALPFSICAILVSVAAIADGGLAPELEVLLQSAARNPQNVSNALNAADRYVAAHPNDGDGFAVRCILDYYDSKTRGGDNSNALADCRRGVSLSPKSGFAHAALGDQLFETSDFKGALSEYSVAISLGETSRGIFWKRCDTYRQLGDLDAALKDCDKQLDLNPDNLAARYTRALVRFEQADYSGALADLNDVLTTDSRFADAFFLRGETDGALGKYPQAEADLTMAIDLGASSAEAYFARGLVRRNLGLTASAIADLEKAEAGYRALHADARVTATEKLIAEIRSSTSTPASMRMPAPNQTFLVLGKRFTSEEVSRLWAGLHAALDPHDTSVHIVMGIEPKDDMPRYDPDWHYLGAQVRPDGTTAISIWLSDALTSSEQSRLVEQGVLLGLTQTGDAGARWKELYDQEAAADENLGANTPDPFLNRRKLAVALAQLYDEAQKEK